MDIFLTVLGILLLLICAVMFLRVSVIIEADEGARVFLKILFIKIKLVPKERKKINLRDFESKRFKRKQEKEKKKALARKKSKQKKEAKKKQKKDIAKEKAKEQPKKKMSVSEIMDIVGLVSKLVGTFFVRFAKRLRLDLARIHITVGGEDAASTAISYGVVCQGVSAVVELLDRITNITPEKNRDIAVGVDFLSDKMKVDIKLSASLRVWHVFDMLFSVAIKFVKEKFLNNN